MGVPPLPRWRMVFVRCAKSSLREVIRNYVAWHSVSYVVPVPPAASIQTGRGYLAKLTTWLALLNGSSLPLLKQNQKKKKKKKKETQVEPLSYVGSEHVEQLWCGSSFRFQHCLTTWNQKIKQGRKRDAKAVGKPMYYYYYYYYYYYFFKLIFFPMFLFVATNRTCTCRQRHDASEWAPGIGKMFIYSRSLSTELLICWTRI